MTNPFALHRSNCFAALLLAMFVVMFVPEVYAADSPPLIPHGTCTTDPQFAKSKLADAGLITTIVDQVKAILETVQRNMFNYIRSDPTFVSAVKAAITLYIAIYGLLSTVGAVPITIYDFMTRMVKLGIVALMLSAGTWDFFNTTVVTFFNNGTDEWISVITSSNALTGSGTAINPNKPFLLVDQALSKALSAKAAVSFMAMIFTPPYGPIIGMLLMLGIGTFVRALLQAAWVYVMSLVIKALLIGLAPIFIACFLFDYTRYLFTGWLNQLVNASLQPVMLFTFIGFFIGMIDAALSNLFENPVCWTEWGDSLRGSPFAMHYWRFATCDGTQCFPYSGKWGFSGPQSQGLSGAPAFPIPILGVLILVMLADLCARFNNVVITIASELAGASVNLAAMSGAVDNLFKVGQSAIGGGGKGGGGGSGGGSLPNMRPNNTSTMAQSSQSAAATTGTRPGVG